MTETKKTTTPDTSVGADAKAGAKRLDEPFATVRY